MTQRFVKGHIAFRNRAGTEQEYLQRLAIDGQQPMALYIGCSDSRVIPELLTGASAGELFVVRNVANYVPALANADCSVGAAIDYAVGVLGVQDVIVCGHTGCGGIRAALEGVEALAPQQSSLRQWVQNLVPTAENARARGFAGEALAQRTTEENVLDSLDNLTSYESVAARLGEGSIGLHAWVYSLENLRLRVFHADHGVWADAEAVL